jgi:RNA recognition motif-containing protein
MFADKCVSKQSLMRMGTNTSNFGDVLSVHIRRDAAGKSLGFGFIQFARPEDAESAMSDLQGGSINNHPIEIRRYLKPFQNP